MNFLKAVAIIFCVCGGSAHAQQLNVQEVLETKQRAVAGGFAARAEWMALGYYLQGVIEGTAGYQKALIAANEAALFCPPSGKSYSVDEIFRFLERSKEADRSRPASRVIIEAYADAFPCRS